MTLATAEILPHMQPFKLMACLGVLSGLLLLLGGAGQCYVSARRRRHQDRLRGADRGRPDAGRHRLLGILGLSLAIRWSGTVVPMGEACKTLVWGTLLAS